MRPAAIQGRTGTEGRQSGAPRLIEAEVGTAAVGSEAVHRSVGLVWKQWRRLGQEPDGRLRPGDTLQTELGSGRFEWREEWPQLRRSSPHSSRETM